MLSLRCTFIIFFMATYAKASVLTIPLDNSDFKYAPASDLTYQGQKLDPIEVMKLYGKGIDISEFEPEKSLLYPQKKLKLKASSDTMVQEYEFDSLLSAPTEFFRSSIRVNGKRFTLTASLYNHSTMVRAALLRLLGYDIETPSFYQNLKLNFSSEAQKALFTTNLEERTLLAKERWIKAEGANSLTLKGVILEDASMSSVPVYWPIMELSRQRDRRLFRALFSVFALTDFSAQVNGISWSVGSIFNEELNLAHPYADAFRNATINDLKWIQHKLSSLSSQQIHESIQFGQYPKPVATILTEKLKSRINYLGVLIGVPSNFTVDHDINAPGVVQGELVADSFEEFVPRFWKEDPLSPFRFSEVFKLFRSQVAYDSISTILDKAQTEFVPSISIGDAANEIRDEVNQFRKKEGYIPLKVWAQPTFAAFVNGSRSIVFGQYQGSVAPIQLVDQVSMHLRGGIFALASGLPSYITPYGQISARVRRSWSHVRAMPDLDTATKQKLSKLFVPKLMKNLGAVLKPSPECSIREAAWVNQEIVGTLKTWVVYYDKADPTGLQNASKLKEDLVNEGVDPQKVILSAAAKDTICELEKSKAVDENLEKFVKEFAIEETFTISDSLVFDGELGARLSIEDINDFAAELGLNKSKALLRSTIFRRTPRGFEITIETQKNNSWALKENLNLFIDILSNTHMWQRGQMDQQVYTIDLVDIDEEQKKLAMRVLKEVLAANSYELLRKYYAPTVLDHYVRLRLGTFNFLWKKRERLKMHHELEITVANKKDIEVKKDYWAPPRPSSATLSSDERTRSFYSALDIKRVGENYHNLLDSIIAELTDSYVGTGASDSDPGRSVHGESRSEYFISEGELTPREDLNIVSKIEYRAVGWMAKARKLEKSLDRIESYYRLIDGGISLDRSLFYDTEKLMSYDLRSTIILYPAAARKLIDELGYGDPQQRRKTLMRLTDPNHYNAICAGQLSCETSQMRWIVKKLNRLKRTQRKDLIDAVNEVYRYLFRKFDSARVLAWIGVDNFFALNYLSGFRAGSFDGHLQHTSNSLGTYSEDYTTGLLDTISTNIGITSYRVKALNYTPGML